MQITGWTEEYAINKEPDLDFFLDQELGNAFPNIEVNGIAFYALDNDFLVESYNDDGDPTNLEVPESLLEQVIKNAASQIEY